MAGNTAEHGPAAADCDISSTSSAPSKALTLIQCAPPCTARRPQRCCRRCASLDPAAEGTISYVTLLRRQDQSRHAPTRPLSLVLAQDLVLSTRTLPVAWARKASAFSQSTAGQRHGVILVSLSQRAFRLDVSIHAHRAFPLSLFVREEHTTLATLGFLNLSSPYAAALAQQNPKSPVASSVTAFEGPVSLVDINRDSSSNCSLCKA